MKNIIVFGVGENAEIFKYCIENDKKYKFDYQVVAFCLNKEYIVKEKHMGIPIVPFENIEKVYSPKDYLFFVALGYTDMNYLREKKYKEVKEKGYNCVNYISSQSDVMAEEIGENNLILNNSVIQPFVKIGNNNVIMGGGLIGHHSSIGDNCFFSVGVNTGGKCIIENNCFIGLNASVAHYLRIRYKTLIGGAAWIARDTEENGVYIAETAIKINKKSYEIKI